jgi:hypothetical protein
MPPIAWPTAPMGPPILRGRWACPLGHDRNDWSREGAPYRQMPLLAERRLDLLEQRWRWPRPKDCHRQSKDGLFF